MAEEETTIVGEIAAQIEESVKEAIGADTLWGQFKEFLSYILEPIKNGAVVLFDSVLEPVGLFIAKYVGIGVTMLGDMIAGAMGYPEVKGMTDLSETIKGSTALKRAGLTEAQLGNISSIVASAGKGFSRFKLTEGGDNTEAHQEIAADTAKNSISTATIEAQLVKELIAKVNTTGATLSEERKAELETIIRDSEAFKTYVTDYRRGITGVDADGNPVLDSTGNHFGIYAATLDKLGKKTVSSIKLGDMPDREELDATITASLNREIDVYKGVDLITQHVPAPIIAQWKEDPIQLQNVALAVAQEIKEPGTGIDIETLKKFKELTQSQINEIVAKLDNANREENGAVSDLDYAYNSPRFKDMDIDLETGEIKITSGGDTDTIQAFTPTPTPDASVRGGAAVGE